MWDIWIAIGVMTFVSAAATLAGRYLYTEKGQRTMLFLAMSVLATIVFQIYFASHLFWARIVPHSAAIIYTSLAAVLGECGLVVAVTT